MSGTAAPRGPEERMRDTLRRLEDDVDAWIATAGGGRPHLVPLSFRWDGESLLVATPVDSVTARNLRESRRVRVGIGPTRDVVLLHGVAEAVPEPAAPVAEAFVDKTGFDPRGLDTPYQFFRIRPRRVQAWREVNEIAGRELMREGRWLVPPEAAAAGRDPAEPPSLRPVGRVESPLTDRAAAPRQGDEGAPVARIVFLPEVREAAADLGEGAEVLVLTWLHLARRDTLSVHPRDDERRPRQGVFSTRSADRPNPIGVHPVTVTAVEDGAVTVSGLEAIDGTPVLDVKPVLGRADRR
ncbi:tRNA-Thr(GGU) m(6)t(6)A37 methyltransferase TsaA [Prauserella shujinwangii]|uniref:tRNA-Thr(GGU) m(6)t(6)A37 methyltransferase TsaA n=1 Tax=Prauserella shujinwangii TaxID=1453103 RepID=A0A2T0LKG9_9PSEU|nr:tRNA (N6-threonylcarbamoyladenosine(37)-N6)-methyltransferase TrmO [Prauserella shujinwangii]PRX43399.1 tRNA-Thr(GGU) m(6)t(6)A37 methyltransferase TsaA [Prauserella shujinwangii]